MYKCAQRELKKLVALTITAAALCPWGTAWAADAPKPDITVEKDGDVVSNPWDYVTHNDTKKNIYLTGKDGKDDSDDISLTVNNLPDDTPYNIISGGWNYNTDTDIEEKNYSHKSVKFSAYEGEVNNIYGAYTQKGRVVGNSAEIYDGTVGAVDVVDDPPASAFVAVGGYGTNGAEENKVTIMGTSTIKGIVVGGLAEGNAADGNTVEMNFGGSKAWALIGGLCYDGNASGNRVTVSYGTIGNPDGTLLPDNPYGGDNPFAEISVAVAGGMATYKVMNNKVNIRDCKDDTSVTGNIYGGYSVNDHAEKNTGEYLSILDCDDLFELDMLEKSYEVAKSHNADVLVFGCDFYDDNDKSYYPCNHSINRKLTPEKNPFNSEDVGRDIFKLFVGWSWDKLFKIY